MFFLCSVPRRFWRFALGLGLAGTSIVDRSLAQPAQAPIMTLSELHPGMLGEVWTVFQGSEPESFTVEVTGVIENTLGPGKSMILCRLTDPRVQNMGAVAGMSGSPLYIDGRFAGALSYQVQRFETVRFAGFTPAEDLLEVRRIAMDLAPVRPRTIESLPATTPPTGVGSAAETGSATTERNGGGFAITPLTPVFAFGGVAPQVSVLMAGPLARLGIATAGLGGSTANPPGADAPPAGAGAVHFALRPGQAVGAALAVGDITLAGTGTVSQVDGDRVLAFGHPLLGLGTVEVPMTSAEIVAILPSNLSSFKIANTGPVIGTVSQDRLSAIYGEIGAPPVMVPVTVRTPGRTLNFASVRHPRLTPMIMATGLAQAVLGSNDAGLAEGFAVGIDVEFAAGERLELSRLYAGPEGFKAGLEGLVQNLSTWLQNPVEEVFPEHVTFTVTPLPSNPTVSLDNVQCTHREARPGDAFGVALALRDFQSKPWRETVAIPLSADWIGRKLEVVITSGSGLDALTGSQQVFPVSQIRDFGAYLDALKAQRRTDGLYVAVLTTSDLFLDQTESTLDLPDSLARIAQGADAARFHRRTVREVLWEQHILPNRLVPGLVRRPLVVTP